MWVVKIKKKADKDIRKLPELIKRKFAVLLIELKEEGPIRKNWPNFGRLKNKKRGESEEIYHCHLKKGKPTYVACWSVENNRIKHVEVYYVGTHEKAPY